MQGSEQVLRCEVAAATLLLNDLGSSAIAAISQPGFPGRDALLIQSFQQSRSTLGPDDLLICDLDGAVVAGPDGLRPPSEVFLDREIFRARPDIQAVAHFHHDLTTAFTLVKGVKLQAVKNHAVRWARGIPVHADPSHVSTPGAGPRAGAQPRLAQWPLDPRPWSGGGRRVGAAGVLIDSIHFVENAQAMYDAACLGPVVPLSADEIAAFSP